MPPFTGFVPGQQSSSQFAVGGSAAPNWFASLLRKILGLPKFVFAVGGVTAVLVGGGIFTFVMTQVPQSTSQPPKSNAPITIHTGPLGKDTTKPSTTETPAAPGQNPSVTTPQAATGGSQSNSDTPPITSIIQGPGSVGTIYDDPPASSDDEDDDDTPPADDGNQGRGGNNGGGNDDEEEQGPYAACALPNYPTASCTGVPAGTALTDLFDDLTIQTDGTVIDGLHVHGCVIVQAANVTIRNTKITCISFYGIASYDVDKPGLIVQDVEIDCDHHNGTGISFNGATITRAHIHGCENGLDITHNVTLKDSYIHDIYEGGSGHGDGIQGSDGSNSLIEHNRIYAESTTAAININNGSGSQTTTTNITIKDNLLAGGAYALYCPTIPTVNYRVLNNRFSTIFHPLSGTFGQTADCDGNEITSGNVMHETGLPFTLQ